MAAPHRASLVLALLAGLQLTGVAGVTHFCQFHCKGEDFPTVCSEDHCPAPGPSCEFFADQPFVDETVCKQYVASEPLCDGKTHQCAEASSFQLVYDRTVDLARTYSGHDWNGVSFLFHPSAAVFVPGSKTFAFGREDIAFGVKALHDHTSAERVVATLRKVLTVRSEGKKVVHSVGTWTPATTNQDFPFYARWMELSDGHWVADTLIAAKPQSSAGVDSTADPLFDAIAARQQDLNRLYNAANFSELAGSLYTSDAVVVGADGALVPQASVADFFGKQPVGKDAKLAPRMVTQAPDGTAAHEVGFSESTRTGYYAKWVQGRAKEWVMELQVFAVFSREPQDAIVKIAPGLILNV